MKHIKIDQNKIPNTSTDKGTLVFKIIIKKYAEYMQKNKNKPEVLQLGHGQKIIYDSDEKLREFLKDGKIEFINEYSLIKYR